MRYHADLDPGLLLCLPDRLQMESIARRTLVRHKRSCETRLLYGIAQHLRDLGGAVKGLKVPLVALPLIAEGIWGAFTPKHAAAAYARDTVVFQLIFAGFGEELLFRGLMQSECNRILGRPFRLGRARFGYGLFLTALVFGFAHLINPFHPLAGAYRLDLGWFLFSTLFALGAGIVREATGGLIAASLLHGALALYPGLFQVTPFSGSAMLLSWVVVALVCITLVRERSPSACC